MNSPYLYCVDFPGLQNTKHRCPPRSEEVRPSVVSVMLDYGERMKAFEADLRTLTREEHAALNVALGLN